MIILTQLLYLKFKKKLLYKNVIFMLTKEMIIGGIKNTKIIELPMYDNEEVAIREISDLEYNQFTSAYRDVGNFDMISTIKAKQTSLAEDTTKFKTSLAAMEKKKYDAKMNLALKVLDNADNPDKFTKKDLEQLRAGTLDLIVNEALIFSGLDNLESMDNNIAEFREEE